MDNSKIVKSKKNKAKSLEERISDFNAKVRSTKDFINKQKEVSQDEKDLIDLSLDTLTDFLQEQMEKRSNK